MNQYELTLLLAPDLQGPALQGALDTIGGFVEELGGLGGTQNNQPRRIRLGVPLKKHQEAYLATLPFAMNAEHIPGLEQRVKTTKDILRFLLHIAPRQKAKVPVLHRPIPQVAEKQKINIQEVDKQLEELFKEKG